jgi:Ca2+-binding RTX toxin-like protein
VISGTGDANDAINGGGGTGDTVEVGGTGNVMLVDFDTTANNIEQWDGNGKALLGTSADNTFDLSGLTSLTGLAYVDGSSGDDQITGSNSTSLDLRGGSGDDTLTAGSQGDTLTGGAGTDDFVGGAGNDTFVISGSNDTFDAFDGGAGTNTIKTTGHVTLHGFDSVGDQISAWTGTGNFHVTGTSLGETFDFSNLTSVDHLAYVDGGSGVDTIIGSDLWAGDLRGGAGNDTLTGGAMDDKLTGASGADTFVFGIGDGHDTIMDFTMKSKTVENTTLDDQINLAGSGLTGYADLQSHMTESANHKDVVITLDSGESLTIKNTTIDILDHHQGDFLFV